MPLPTPKAVSTPRCSGYKRSMKWLVIAAALLALGGCKGSWQKCGVLIYRETPTGQLFTKMGGRYRVINPDPLTIEWEEQRRIVDGTTATLSGVTQVDSVDCSR